MMENRFWLLLAKKTAGEILPEEEEALREMLAAHPEYHMVLEALEGMQAEHRVFPGGLTAERFVHEGFEQVQAAHEAGVAAASRRRRRVRISVAAATFALVALAGSLFLWHRSARPSLPAYAGEAPNQVTTKNGSRTKITLPDGSRIWLNGGSTLTYPNSFSGRCREIGLQGEGYFEIRTDPSHPFVIHTRQVIIRVLGTAFNVRAYRNEKKTVTTLVSGTIDVAFATDPKRHVLLKHPEKLTVLDPIGGDPHRLHSAVDYHVSDFIPDTVKGVPPQEIAWVGNRLVFQNETFREVAFKMERWYDVVFCFADKSLEKEMLTGAFGKEKLEDALRALALTTPFRYRIRGDTVYLKRTE